MNSKGQLGIGNTDNMGDSSVEMGDNLPSVNLGTGRTATATAAGREHVCAILDDSSVKCWGRNNQGQLGLDNTDDMGDGSGEMGDNLPSINLGTGRTANAIALGDYHSCAKLDNSSIKCLGGNQGGKLGIGNANNIGDSSEEMAQLIGIDL